MPQQNHRTDKSIGHSGGTRLCYLYSFHLTPIQALLRAPAEKAVNLLLLEALSQRLAIWFSSPRYSFSFVGIHSPPSQESFQHLHYNGFYIINFKMEPMHNKKEGLRLAELDLFLETHKESDDDYNAKRPVVKWARPWQRLNIPQGWFRFGSDIPYRRNVAMRWFPTHNDDRVFGRRHSARQTLYPCRYGYS